MGQLSAYNKLYDDNLIYEIKNTGNVNYELFFHVIDEIYTVMSYYTFWVLNQKKKRLKVVYDGLWSREDTRIVMFVIGENMAFESTIRVNIYNENKSNEIIEYCGYTHPDIVFGDKYENLMKDFSRVLDCEI